MMKSVKRNLVAALVISIFCCVNTAFACDCAVMSTDDAVEKSSMVFSGKVIGSEYRKGIPQEFMRWEEAEDGKQPDYETLVVKIQVEQWWKGEAPREVVLVTSTVRNADGTMTVSSCDYRFREGESYLIYAVGKKGRYATSACLRTKRLSQAEEDLKILGEGKSPVEKSDEPDDSSGRSLL